MQFNMLDAKSQLSRLVKAALAAASPALVPAHVDAAFSEAVDQHVARLFGS